MSDAAYSLVLPFVVCQSRGGPYEDQAFVAGWELGNLAALLATSRALTRIVRTIRTASLPQVDLIAMQNGFLLETEIFDDEWAVISLTRVQT